MPVAINNSTRPDTDLDKIAKGLGIAKNVFGIAADVPQFMAAYQKNKQLSMQNAETEAMSNPDSTQSQYAQQNISALYHAMGHVKDMNGNTLMDPSDVKVLTAPQMLSHQSARDLSQVQESALAKLAQAQVTGNANQMRMAGMVDVRNRMLNETMNKNASQIGSEWEADPIIHSSKTVLNSLSRADQIINGKTPVTAQAAMMIQQDVVNAAAQGNISTEGKVGRETIETARATLSTLKQKAGMGITDLRKNDPEFFTQLQGQIGEMRGEWQNAMASQALNRFQSYTSSDNPKVQQVNLQKLQTYNPQAYQEMMKANQPGGSQPQAPQQQPGFTPPAPSSYLQNSKNDGGGGGIVPSAQADNAIVDPTVASYAKIHQIPYESAAPLVNSFRQKQQRDQTVKMNLNPNPNTPGASPYGSQ